jgi:chromosome condensin MukBEF MukE localization factor
MTESPNKGKDSQQNVGMNNIGDEFDKLLEKTKVKVINESNSAVATTEDVDAVITTIMQNKKIANTQENYTKVLATVSHLVQIGATSPKFASTRMISDYGIEVRAGDLREACNKNGITVRKFARGIRNQVIKVAMTFNIQGNLSKNYKLENPACDNQDLIWVSDFQTFSENPAMPENVKSWLLENYRNRFRPELRREM